MRPTTLLHAPLCFAITAIVSIGCFGQAVPGVPAPRPDPSKSRPATKPCTLTQATLAKIAGVQMGSTYDDILSLHPEIAEDKFFQKKLEEENSGLTYIQVRRVFDEPDRERPAKVSLFFTDRILSVIGVESGGLADFKSINEAIASYSSYLGVGKDQWAIEYGYSGILRCDGFSFYANSFGEGDGAKANSIYIHADVKPKKY